MKFKFSSCFDILECVYYFIHEGYCCPLHERKLGRRTKGAIIARSIETAIKREVNES